MRVFRAAFFLFLLFVLPFYLGFFMKGREKVESSSACVGQPAEVQSCAPFNSYSGRKLDTDVVDALPAGHWSDALQKLFQETKGSAKVPIRFTMQTADAFGFIVHVNEGYVIGIRPDLGHEEQESDISHELYHIVLQRKGYASQIHTPEDASPYLQALGYTITSCVDDAIIDEKTSALGFHPDVLNRRRYEDLRLPADVQVRLQDPIYRDGTALVIACDAFRKGNGNKLLTRWKLVSADAARHAEELQNKIGKIACADAKTCNEKKKQIRDILHYPILLCNPLVGKWE